jgi:hypothetical protein
LNQLFIGGRAEESGGEKNEKPTRYKIVEFEWEEVQLPLTIAIWIFVACIAKISKFIF